MNSCTPGMVRAHRASSTITKAANTATPTPTTARFHSGHGTFCAGSPADAAGAVAGFCAAAAADFGGTGAGSSSRGDGTGDGTGADVGVAVGVAAAGAAGATGAPPIRWGWPIRCLAGAGWAWSCGAGVCAAGAPMR